MAYECVATWLVKDGTEVLTCYSAVARSGSRRETMYPNEQSLLVHSNSQCPPVSFAWRSLRVLYLYDSSSNSTMVLLRLCIRGSKDLVVDCAREHVRRRDWSNDGEVICFCHLSVRLRDVCFCLPRAYNRHDRRCIA